MRVWLDSERFAGQDKLETVVGIICSPALTLEQREKEKKKTHTNHLYENRNQINKPPGVNKA